MEWREDVGPARAGDAAARERLREYLTPFAHGIALSHAPHHLAEKLVPRILEEAMRTLGGVDDDGVGVHVINVARRLARDSTPGAIEEQGTAQAALLEARQSLSRLRALPEQTRERFLLRVVEGIPGPELAAVARVAPGELRAELERGAAEAARAFGQGQSFAGDEYLWELTGTPPPLLARLEMQLPVLRFDPTAAPLSEASVAGTFQELAPVSGLGGPMKPLLFDEEPEGTETGVVTTHVPAVARPALDVPNPFEVAMRTIAATDLPAEARGQMPVAAPPEPASSKSGKMAPLPPRPVPAPGDPERSGKSNSGKSSSNKSGKLGPEVSNKSGGRMTAVPPRPDVTKEGPKLIGDEHLPTQAKVPALILAAQAEIATSPEADMLGRPTMQMPIAAAVGLGRNPVSTEETRIGGATVPTAQPGLTDAPVFQGTQPLFAAGGLILIGLIVYSASLFAADRQARANWTLAQVVVAAEELGVGDIVTLENVALRAVPEPFQGSGVVRGEMMNFILDQKLAVGVQMGDPLFLSQFVSMRVADQRLSKRVFKRTRGYTISTNVVAAVGRWVRPGDIVDVLVTFSGKDGPRKQVERRAVTLLQKVTVLATGKVADALGEATMDERDKAYGEVTVLLSPEEVEALTLARTVGKVKLTLRNGDDLEDDRNLDGAYTDSDTLLDGARQRVVRSKRQKIIQFIRAAPAIAPR